jgi:Spy/CpxP family protein refolding chaperone
MKFSRTSIILYMGLVFACGAVLGVFGQRLYSASAVISATNRPRPEELRKKALAEYQSRLKLTDDQVSKFNSLMDETKARTYEIRRQMHPQYEKVHQEQTEKVRQILTPEQRDEYDRMLKEREERQKRNGDRGPGPGI